MLHSAEKHSASSKACDQEIKQKIDILLEFIQNFSMTAQGPFPPDYYIDMLLESYETRIKDQVWLHNVVDAFKKTDRMMFAQEKWIKQALLNLGLYTCFYDKTRFDLNYRCYELYIELTQQKISGPLKTIEEAFAREVQYKEVLDHYELAQYGDVVVYYNEGEAKHIGIYLMSFSGNHYVLSKFGQHNIMIHPIEHVPQSYGQAVCYQAGDALHLKHSLTKSLAKSAALPFEEELLDIIRQKEKPSKHPSYLPMLSQASAIPPSLGSSSENVATDKADDSYGYYCRIL